MLAALLLLTLVACAPPAPTAAGSGRTLFVANGEADTISRLDSATGRLSGPPVPAGKAPWQIAVGPHGSLLVLSISPRHTGDLTFIARQGQDYVPRQVSLEPRAREGHMASDGRHAIVAYHLAGKGRDPEPRCRLALIDLATGELLASHTICGAHESVFTVASVAGPDGPLAYAGIWRWAHPTADGEWVPGRGRLVRLDARSGAVQDALPLEGAPTSAVLASDAFAGRHAGGQRLYLVETLPGPANEYSDPDSWKLLAIDPLTFEVSARHALSEAPLWLSVAPDGRDAYYAVGGSNAIAHVDLGSGATRRLAALPGSGLGLAVSHERLFVPDPRGDEVWVVERRSGRRLRPIATGRHPIGLTLDG